MFCGASAVFDNDNVHEIMNCDCPVCGHYILTLSFHSLLKNSSKEETYKLTCYLFHTKKERNYGMNSRIRFLGTKEEYNRFSFPGEVHVTLENVDSWFPGTFNAKINMILLALADRTNTYGEQVVISSGEIISCCFVNRYQDEKQIDYEKIKQQKDFYIDYLKHNNYLYLSQDITLTAEGWQRVDELQRDRSNNREVFVSMSFADSTKPIREAIRTGIVNAGFSPDFMDEIIHNQQIVPEMLRLIRECRLLVLDITDPNYGAYYEAGYALGLGKEVIITCSREKMNQKYETEEEKKYERYLKPHFDIAQKQILVWDDYKDLTVKLTAWIKELMTR